MFREERYLKGKLIEKALPCVEAVDVDFFKRLGRNQEKYKELLQLIVKELGAPA